MAEFRLTVAEINALVPPPCEPPFIGNRYRDEATGDLVLPDGWTDEVIAYYAKERGNALTYLAAARKADGSKVIPVTTRQAIKAVQAARPPKPPSP